MKMAARLVLTATVLAAGLATAQAQVIDRINFKTNFPFVAGNTALPAGTYTVAALDDDPSILQLTNGRVSVLLETEGDQPGRMPSRTEVRFHKYGDTYVLHEIVDVAAEGGRVILPSHAEKRHQKAHATPTPYAVAASVTPKK